MTEDNTRYDRALRQLEAIHRSERVPILYMDKVVLLAEKCRNTEVSI